MAVSSVLVPLGTPAPDFALPDLDDRVHTLASFTDSVLVVAFACNHCPYVQHIEKELARAATDLSADVVAICSNDVDSYPDDGPDGLRDQADRAGWTFPYLIDADQTVARNYGAVCTPDFFVYGADRRLAYRGAFDTSTPGNGEPLDGRVLIDAVTAIKRGESVPEPHRPSMGCSIKWKASADQ